MPATYTCHMPKNNDHELLLLLILSQICPKALLVPTWGLSFIGDDAADKVRLGGTQVSHQLVEVLL